MFYPEEGSNDGVFSARQAYIYLKCPGISRRL